MSDNKNFFKTQTDSSRVKASIVSEYFPQYCKIISRRHIPERFGYFDMFAGPGAYEDGSLSTPLLIAKKCYDDPFLRNKVWMIFNDMNYGQVLKENFEKRYESGSFEIEPFFSNREFGNWPKIDSFLTRSTMRGYYNECPTLLFIDPFGYKDINTRVLTQFLTQWGNEVFIFINTKRINAAIFNERFQNDLKIIFPLTYENVKTELESKKGRTEEKHMVIIKNLHQEFIKVLQSTVYYTAFQFREEGQDTPSHFLLHITKGYKGFDLVKQVYSKYANVDRVLDDVGGDITYTFDPRLKPDQSWFYDDFKQDNINNLKAQLCQIYNGCTITTEALFNEDQKKRLCSRTHYLQALRQLVEEKKIEITYTDGRNHKASVLISSSCVAKFI